MTPTARLAVIVATASVAFVGAGLALASIGTPDDSASAETAAPSNLQLLTRQLERLDSRSNDLQRELGVVRQRAAIDTSSPSPSTSAFVDEDFDDFADEHGDDDGDDRFDGRDDDFGDDDDHDDDHGDDHDDDDGDDHDDDDSGHGSSDDD